MTKFERCGSPPAELRHAYLDSLPQPQELYLEMQVAAGTTWRFADTAYVVQSATQLVELYVIPEQTSRLLEIFDAAMLTTGAVSVLCKSYDTQLLYAALSKPANVYPSGLLFRRITDTSFTNRTGATIRQGREDDAPTIFSFNDGFFLSLEEIRSYAASDGLFVLEKGDTVIGCGIGKPVVKNRPHIDIGMLIAAEYRRQGFGTHIISFLKDHYLEQGLTPICGCSIDNTGSQRTLTKAGFVSEHHLLEISY